MEINDLYKEVIKSFIGEFSLVEATQQYINYIFLIQEDMFKNIDVDMDTGNQPMFAVPENPCPRYNYKSENWNFIEMTSITLQNFIQLTDDCIKLLRGGSHKEIFKGVYYLTEIISIYNNYKDSEDKFDFEEYVKQSKDIFMRLLDLFVAMPGEENNMLIKEISKYVRCFITKEDQQKIINKLETLKEYANELYPKNTDITLIEMIIHDYDKTDGPELINYYKNVINRIKQEVTEYLQNNFTRQNVLKINKMTPKLTLLFKVYSEFFRIRELTIRKIKEIKEDKEYYQKIYYCNEKEYIKIIKGDCIDITNALINCIDYNNKDDVNSDSFLINVIEKLSEFEAKLNSFNSKLLEMVDHGNDIRETITAQIGHTLSELIEKKDIQSGMFKIINYVNQNKEKEDKFAVKIFNNLLKNMFVSLGAKIKKSNDLDRKLNIFYIKFGINMIKRFTEKEQKQKLVTYAFEKSKKIVLFNVLRNIRNKLLKSKNESNKKNRFMWFMFKSRIAYKKEKKKEINTIDKRRNLIIKKALFNMLKNANQLNLTEVALKHKQFETLREKNNKNIFLNKIKSIKKTTKEIKDISESFSSFINTKRKKETINKIKKLRLALLMALENESKIVEAAKKEINETINCTEKIEIIEQPFISSTLSALSIQITNQSPEILSINKLSEKIDYPNDEPNKYNDKSNEYDDEFYDSHDNTIFEIPDNNEILDNDKLDNEILDNDKLDNEILDDDDDDKLDNESNQLNEYDNTIFELDTVKIKPEITTNNESNISTSLITNEQNNKIDTLYIRPKITPKLVNKLNMISKIKNKKKELNISTNLITNEQNNKIDTSDIRTKITPESVNIIPNLVINEQNNKIDTLDIRPKITSELVNNKIDTINIPNIISNKLINKSDTLNTISKIKTSKELNVSTNLITNKQNNKIATLNNLFTKKVNKIDTINVLSNKIEKTKKIDNWLYGSVSGICKPANSLISRIIVSINEVIEPKPKTTSSVFAKLFDFVFGEKPKKALPIDKVNIIKKPDNSKAVQFPKSVLKKQTNEINNVNKNVIRDLISEYTNDYIDFNFNKNIPKLNNAIETEKQQNLAYFKKTFFEVDLLEEKSPKYEIYEMNKPKIDFIKSITEYTKTKSQNTISLAEYSNHLLSQTKKQKLKFLENKSHIKQLTMPESFKLPLNVDIIKKIEPILLQTNVIKPLMRPMYELPTLTSLPYQINKFIKMTHLDNRTEKEKDIDAKCNYVTSMLIVRSILNDNDNSERSYKLEDFRNFPGSIDEFKKEIEQQYREFIDSDPTERTVDKILEASVMEKMLGKKRRTKYKINKIEDTYDIYIEPNAKEYIYNYKDVLEIDETFIDNLLLNNKFIRLNKI